MLLREFRRQLDEGMWAAVLVADAGTGRREAVLITDFEEIPEDAERVLFCRAPPAARPSARRAVGGLGVVVLVVTLGALAAVMGRPMPGGDCARARPARRFRPGSASLLCSPRRPSSGRWSCCDRSSTRTSGTSSASSVIICVTAGGAGGPVGRPAGRRATAT